MTDKCSYFCESVPHKNTPEEVNELVYDLNFRKPKQKCYTITF